jgi:hypothetical protein
MMVAFAGHVWQCVERHDEWDTDLTLAHLNIGHGRREQSTEGSNGPATNDRPSLSLTHDAVVLSLIDTEDNTFTTKTRKRRPLSSWWSMPQQECIPMFFFLYPHFALL